MTSNSRQSVVRRRAARFERARRLADLNAIELVGQRDDVRRETAAQSAQMKAEADAAKAK
jgi:hypothetical protein